VLQVLAKQYLRVKKAASGFSATICLIMSIPQRQLEKVTNKKHVSIQSIVIFHYEVHILTAARSKYSLKSYRDVPHFVKLIAPCAELVLMK
jgi:L-cystine uptake protein TcyP (sodium:dicarboxylate symporter family)